MKIHLGKVVLFTRGERSWRLTVPKDGSLPMGGLLPAFIEWSPGVHPSTAQQDSGVKLDKVQLSTPDPEALVLILKILQVENLAEVRQGDVGLSFSLHTADGLIMLEKLDGGYLLALPDSLFCLR